MSKKSIVCLSYYPVGRGKCGNCNKSISTHSLDTLQRTWSRVVSIDVVVEPRQETFAE